ASRPSHTAVYFETDAINRLAIVDICRFCSQRATALTALCRNRLVMCACLPHDMQLFAMRHSLTLIETCERLSCEVILISMRFARRMAAINGVPSFVAVVVPFSIAFYFKPFLSALGATGSGAIAHTAWSLFAKLTSS